MLRLVYRDQSRLVTVDVDHDLVAIPEKVEGMNTEPSSELLDGAQGDVPLAPLEPSDVRPMQVEPLSHRLLRKAPGPTQYT